MTITKSEESSKEFIEALVKEITTLLEPVKTKGKIVFIVSSSHEDSSGYYAIFGNLPYGQNQNMVRDAAINMAINDLNLKIEEAKAMAEAKDPNITVN
jgi:hypothetical protein